MKKRIFQSFIFTLMMVILSSNINVGALSFNNNLLVNYVTKYKELPSLTVDKNKQFTITFNKDINYKTINGDTIKVFDSANKEVNVIAATGVDNNKAAIVMPPSGGYIEGGIYTLIVKQGILDITGLNLLEEVSMKFTVKDSTTPTPIETKSANELFIENLYNTNSPYWNFGAFFVNGNLNINYYNYTTQTNNWKTLSTSFNTNINNQTIDVFKALYIPKEGYKANIEYNIGEDNSGISSISLNGKTLGEEFIKFDLYTSANATISSKNVDACLLIPQLSSAIFNGNKSLIKNPLSVIVGTTNIDAIYLYITNEYSKCIITNSYNITTYKQYDKTFGNIKVSIWSNGKRVVAEFTK